MHQLVGYHRPTSVSDARALLEGENRIVLGGGTTIRHDGGGEPTEVVDLQSLGLDGIENEDSSLRLGATTRLQELADHALVPDVVREAAGLEQPSTLRTLATVGGTIGARDPESVLTTALLAYDAIVGFADERELPLGDVLRDGLAPGDLITYVDIANTGTGAIARTGRTPADKPIVAAVGRTSDGGVRIALSGVGAVPMVVDPDKIEDLEPPGDFRGSTQYRRHLAATLSARVEGILA